MLLSLITSIPLLATPLIEPVPPQLEAKQSNLDADRRGDKGNGRRAPVFKHDKGNGRRTNPEHGKGNG